MIWHCTPSNWDVDTEFIEDCKLVPIKSNEVEICLVAYRCLLSAVANTIGFAFIKLHASAQVQGHCFTH